MKAYMFRELAMSVVAIGFSMAVASAADVTLPDSPLKGKHLVISMQYDWEPVAFKDDAGNPTGYFHDITTEAAKRLGATYEITSGDFAAVIPAIQSGKFDAAVGFDATPQRQAVVDVVAHTIGGYRLIVKSDSPLPESADLSAFCGKTIALLASHPSHLTLEAGSKKCIATGQQPIKIDAYPDQASDFIAVRSGRADATVGYTGEMGWMLKKDKTLKRIGPVFDTAYAGIPIKKGSPLGVWWQKAIDSMIADGSYIEILKKYGTDDTAIPASIINPAK